MDESAENGAPNMERPENNRPLTSPFASETAHLEPSLAEKTQRELELLKTAYGSEAQDSPEPPPFHIKSETYQGFEAITNETDVPYTQRMFIYDVIAGLQATGGRVLGVGKFANGELAINWLTPDGVNKYDLLKASEAMAANRRNPQTQKIDSDEVAIPFEQMEAEKDIFKPADVIVYRGQQYKEVYPIRVRGEPIEGKEGKIEWVEEILQNVDSPTIIQDEQEKNGPDTKPLRLNPDQIRPKIHGDVESQLKKAIDFTKLLSTHPDREVKKLARELSHEVDARINFYESFASYVNAKDRSGVLAAQRMITGETLNYLFQKEGFTEGLSYFTDENVVKQFLKGDDTERDAIREDMRKIILSAVNKQRKEAVTGHNEDLADSVAVLVERFSKLTGELGKHDEFVGVLECETAGFWDEWHTLDEKGKRKKLAKARKELTGGDQKALTEEQLNHKREEHRDQGTGKWLSDAGFTEDITFAVIESLEKNINGPIPTLQKKTPTSLGDNYNRQMLRWRDFLHFNKKLWPQIHPEYFELIETVWDKGPKDANGDSIVKLEKLSANEQSMLTWFMGDYSKGKFKGGKFNPLSGDFRGAFKLKPKKDPDDPTEPTEYYTVNDLLDAEGGYNLDVIDWKKVNFNILHPERPLNSWNYSNLELANNAVDALTKGESSFLFDPEKVAATAKSFYFRRDNGKTAEQIFLQYFAFRFKHSGEFSHGIYNERIALTELDKYFGLLDEKGELLIPIDDRDEMRKKVLILADYFKISGQEKAAREAQNIGRLTKEMFSRPNRGLFGRSIFAGFGSFLSSVFGSISKTH